MKNKEVKLSWVGEKKAVCFDLLCNTCTLTVLFRVTPFLNFRLHTYFPLSSSLPWVLFRDRFPFFKSDVGISPASCSAFQSTGSSREREKSLCGSGEMRPESSWGKNSQCPPWMPTALTCPQETWEEVEHGMLRSADLDVYSERDTGGERSVWEEGKKVKLIFGSRVNY